MNYINLIKTLQSNRFKVNYFEAKEDAVAYISSQITDTTVGFGDSGTISSLNLYKALSKNNVVYDPQNCTENEDFYDIAKKCLTTDIFITSINAISETGEMVNIDGAGNRIAGSLFGHSKVYFVIGTNKVVKTLDDAIWRARNVAAPQNAKRLGAKTPCAIKGDKCYDCSSPERICNALTIYYKKMSSMDMEILLIDEDLGL